VPFDIERYLAYHFTKVGEQTRTVMHSYARLGHEYGLDVSAVESLQRLLAAPT